MPRPGPMLLKHDATAEKFVTKSSSSKLTASTSPQNRSMYRVKYALHSSARGDDEDMVARENHIVAGQDYEFAAAQYSGDECI